MPQQTQPGFFEILASRRAYTTLLYLLLSMTTGILAFTYAVAGISLSLGLAVLIIGLPVALVFLAGTRLLALGETRLLGLLVAGSHPVSALRLLPDGEGWAARVKALVADRRTWTSLLYFLLLLPLGIAYFTVMTTLLALGLGFAALPLAALFHAKGTFSMDMLTLPAWCLAHPALAFLLLGLAGLAILPLTLHLGLLLGRFQLWLARHLLIEA